MDADSMSFHYEESFSGSFSIFEPTNFDTECENLENTFGTTDENVWEWEVERELNGDVALIPMTSDVAMTYLSTSPPKEDFQKIMNEWQNLMNMEISDMETLSAEIQFPDDGSLISATDTISPLPLLPQPPSDSLIEIKPKLLPSAGKKIDMEAQCYIVGNKSSLNIKQEHIEKEEECANEEHAEENEQDTEDFEDEEPEAKKNLQIKTEPIDIIENEINSAIFNPKTETEQNLALNTQNDAENDYVDVDTVPESNTPILEAKDVNSLLEQFEATESVTRNCKQNVLDNTKMELHSFEEPAVSKITINCKIERETVNQTESEKNKQILNALPQELIMKIKASSKRKVVPLIDPIPNKRRTMKKSQPEPPIVLSTANKTEKVNAEYVQREHDYCSWLTPYPKYPKKDSGFESAEEEEQRNILRNQPTVKRADGKLMVSLLKINTIKNNSTNNEIKKKRKLNLEEYKKRREGVIRSCDDSQSNSPITSGRSSPLIHEDDQTRLLKHQQKLMQMADEVLKTPPKNSRQMEIPVDLAVKPEIAKPTENIPPPLPSLPENVEVKTLVSIGVNTDFDLQKQASACVTELEEIEPILKSANAKISNNSLITSVLENIQNKQVQDKEKTLVKQVDKNKNSHEHGEDKTIVYLDKNRQPVATNSIAIQTDIPETIRKHRRRRSTSRSSSECHRKSYKWRSSSNDSSYSYSSQSSSSAASSSSSSSFRSRSPSPTPHRPCGRRKPELGEEHIREVEERRIVYVGGISSTMTKEGLRRRFQKFGPINNISIHFREYGENYGFVTFAYKSDAYQAVERGNDDQKLPQYDLSFGGRRIFCGASYSDLDNVHDDMNPSFHIEDSFDNLLREFQAKLRKRKSCQ